MQAIQGVWRLSSISRGIERWPDFFERVHIRFCGNGGYWFRSYSGSLGRAPSNQGLLPLSFGASLWLGMPSLRSCSVGPPPSAIHGRGRLTRHPCRVAHCAEPALGLSRGACTAKPKPRRPTGRPVCRVRSSVRIELAGRPPSRASPLPQYLRRTHFFEHHQTCGSGLAREEAGTSNIDVA